MTKYLFNDAQEVLRVYCPYARNCENKKLMILVSETFAIVCNLCVKRFVYLNFCTNRLLETNIFFFTLCSAQIVLEVD